MLRKSTIAISIAAAVFVLSGCSGNSGLVTSKTEKPTGTNAKLQKQIESFKNGGEVKNSFSKMENFGDKAVLNEMNIDQDSLKDLVGVGGGNGHGKLGSVTGGDTPACIEDNIVTTETNTSATIKGTFAFNNCTFSNGTKIDGSFPIPDFKTLDIENENVIWDKAKIIINTSNLKGITSQVEINILS